VIPQFSSNITKLILKIGNFRIVVVLIKKMPNTRSKSKSAPSETTARTKRRRHSSSDSEHPLKQARHKRNSEAAFGYICSSEDDRNLTIQPEADYSSSDGESKEDVDTPLISPNIGFGETGIFGLEDIIQLAKDDTKPNEDENPADIIQDLRDNCVAKNSKRSYRNSICAMILHYYKFDKSKLHKEWVRIIDTFSEVEHTEKKDNKSSKKQFRNYSTKGILDVHQ